MYSFESCTVLERVCGVPQCHSRAAPRVPEARQESEQPPTHPPSQLRPGAALQKHIRLRIRGRHEAGQFSWRGKGVPSGAENLNNPSRREPSGRCEGKGKITVNEGQPDDSARRSLDLAQLGFD
ncbi:hypothetical protein E2C01_020787 [Portunus trituberculatus]|uniref:Uncharacterized protein n=1 Tax=Portunus trituberculatus TaxID=210409 RepID=A0A5B7E315_PORTR|nr:hypothetical protein [Portunus trituberculatus]